MAVPFDIDKIRDTDELQSYFPNTENEFWEFKDAQKLTDDIQKLENELAIQASAFSNTDGGILVFGYPDRKWRQPQSCQLKVKSQDTEDWLRQKITTLVERPLNNYHIRRIPIAANLSEFVIVIVFNKSVNGAHQAKINKTYYWRNGSSSEPAPHYYWELIWNQSTKAVLSVTDVAVRFGGIIKDTGIGIESSLSMDLIIKVINTSLICATMWGVHYRVLRYSRWTRRDVELSASGSLRPTQDHLLPDEQAEIVLTLHNRISTPSDRMKHLGDILEDAANVAIELRPVSHNFIGETFVLDLSSAAMQAEIESRLCSQWPKLKGGFY